jgi:hypothetical protein
MSAPRALTRGQAAKCAARAARLEQEMLCLVDDMLDLDPLAQDSRTQAYFAACADLMGRARTLRLGLLLVGGGRMSEPTATYTVPMAPRLSAEQLVMLISELVARQVWESETTGGTRQLEGWLDGLAPVQRAELERWELYLRYLVARLRAGQESAP